MANFVSTMMIDFMRYLGNSNVRIEYWQWGRRKNKT
jgi:hypothetical protein